MKNRAFAGRVALTRWLGAALLVALLIISSIPFIFPFWWMIIGSLKNPTEIFAFPPTLLPKEWQWQNYVEVFRYQPYALHYFNSVYIAVLVTIGTLFVAALSGYAFARIPFPGRSLLFILLLSGIMMPSEVLIIPNFFLMKMLGLNDTHFPLIAIPILGAPAIVGTFMMRQFFVSIPHEIEDAATVDGANRFGIFWHIALPVATPALGGLAILTYLASWNLFLEPLVYLDSINLWTIPLSLRNFVDPYGTPLWHLQLAETTLCVLPSLVLYVVYKVQIVDRFATSVVRG